MNGGAIGVGAVRGLMSSLGGLGRADWGWGRSLGGSSVGAGVGGAEGASMLTIIGGGVTAVKIGLWLNCTVIIAARPRWATTETVVVMDAVRRRESSRRRVEGDVICGPWFGHSVGVPGASRR